MKSADILQIEKELKSYLRELYGNNASFRDGQLEAIVSTLTNKFTLLVQKTGWGKSLIYFFATKYLRAKGYAPTIIISPLISLMNNQFQAAEKLGLSAVLVNNQTMNMKAHIYARIERNMVDIIFITPEQLNKEISVISSKKWLYM